MEFLQNELSKKAADVCNECFSLTTQLEQARQSHRNDIKSFAQER